MTFDFKLFRALTSFNLFFSGFFLMMLLVTLFSGAGPALIFFLLIGSVFMHSLVSVQLQKSLMDKSIAFKRGGRLLGFGVAAIFYAGLLILSYIIFQVYHDRVVDEMTKQIALLPKDQQKEITPEILRSTMNAIMVFLVIFALTILANVHLSFSFLKEWKNRKDTNIDLDINDINVEH
jgi:hypothetical protein